MAQIYFLSLSILLGTRGSEELDIVSKMLEHLEGKLYCLTLPSASAFLAIVVVLELEDLFRQRPTRHDCYALEAAVEPGLDRLQLCKAGPVLEPIALLAASDHADDDSEDYNEEEGT